MKKPNKKTLRNKLDSIVSKIVRSKGYCVKCGKNYNLQAAHIFSRRFMSIRWDFDNILCLCAGCHFEAHLKPIFFSEWVKEYLSEEKYAQLKIKANSIKKINYIEMAELYEALLKIHKG